MSGMHSNFSSSVTGDKSHSYALLSAIQQGNAAQGSPTQFSPSQQKVSDTASVSSFGSSVSLLKGKLHRSHHNSSSSASHEYSSPAASRSATADASPEVLKAQMRLTL